MFYTWCSMCYRRFQWSVFVVSLFQCFSSCVLCFYIAFFVVSFTVPCFVFILVCVLAGFSVLCSVVLYCLCYSRYWCSIFSVLLLFELHHVSVFHVMRLYVGCFAVGSEFNTLCLLMVSIQFFFFFFV